MRRLDPRIAGALIALLVAVGIAAARITLSSLGERGGDRKGNVLFRSDPAPELAGLSPWFNSEPLTLAELRGKVVLIDFWTFSCINCVRTFPELRAFHDTYKDSGLVVLGVHSPEFDFETVPANVQKAMRSHSVVWPVAIDNDHKTWSAFDNHYWPHVYLIDAEGTIRYDRIGEGGGAEIERAIRLLLQEAGATLPPPSAVTVEGPSAGITPEIYLGYLRGGDFFGNPDGYVRDEPADYSVPDEPPLPAGGRGVFFLDGRWTATEDYVASARQEVRIVLPFSARDVYIVAGPGTGTPGGATEVEVRLDGGVIDASRAGSDVTGGILRLDRKDLFHLAHFDAVETHELVLRVKGPGLHFYAFTFG